jgi:putative colanic acid biosynthesis acetyltransferase WcaF
MEEYSCLGEEVDCYCVDKIHLGAHATVSQYTFLCSASHDINSPNMGLITAPIRIGPAAWICADVFVGPGVTIGEGAVAAARSVVVDDVEPWTVVGGHPAQFIKQRTIKQGARQPLALSPQTPLSPIGPLGEGGLLGGEGHLHNADTISRAYLPQVRSVQSSPLPLAIKLKMGLWRLVQNSIFRWSPGRCRGFRRWLLRLFGAQIAPRASIHRTARIECPWNLQMADFASVGEESWIYNLDQIVLDEYACIGQRAVLLTGSHDFEDPTFPLMTKPIRVGYGAWIALGAILLPGVWIGRLAVIGAGSVVSRSMPEEMICAGNPCKPIKKRVFRHEFAPIGEISVSVPKSCA